MTSDYVPARRLTRLFGLAATLVAFTLDQATKLIALATLGRGEPQAVLPIFNLRLSFNPGISFSLFVETFADRPVMLAGITLVIVALLVLFLVKSDTRLEGVAFGLIIGGALGNALDRVRLGAVVDFLDFHLWGYHWPAFNLADSAIAVGVALLILAATTGPHSQQADQSSTRSRRRR